MPIIRLAFKSLQNRWFSAFLTFLGISLSVTLFLGVERLRMAAESSFENTLSGTDLLVGARTGPVQLLLYSVFRLGNPTNNITWESYQDLKNKKEIQWTIPISLGDSHKGYRVVGTNENYFKHYQYADKKPLRFAHGMAFSDLYDAVVGADVAEKLGYQVGTEIALAHGIEEVAFRDHKDHPFRVVGILEKTGTPVDQSVHVSLEAIEAIHLGWEQGAPPRPGEEVSAKQARLKKLQPKEITAVLVGLRSKVEIFNVRRFVNDYRQEPLMAVIPTLVFRDLWKTLSVVESALRAISVFVVLTGLLGMLTSLLTSLNERRREMAILRSVGAKPVHVFCLMLSEATLLTTLGSMAGAGFVYSLLAILQPFLEKEWGLFLAVSGPTLFDMVVIALVVGVGSLMGLIPAYQAYRRSLSDGLSIRV